MKRSLAINKRKIYYANPIEIIPIRDEWGNLTGSYEYQYEDPKPLKIMVSAGKGGKYTNPFGNYFDYDKMLTTNDLTLSIGEDTIFWVDNQDLTQPHDYVIKRIADGLNSKVYAIGKVNQNA